MSTSKSSPDSPQAGLAHQPNALQLLSVINAAPLVLWVLDKEGMFTLSEGAGLEKLGLKSGDVVGQSVFDLYADSPEIIEASKRALAGEASSTITNLGNVFYEIHYTPLYNPEGEIQGCIGVAVDITERKQAENQLKESEERFTFAVESAGDGIWDWDMSTNDVRFSRLWLGMLGYEEDEFPHTFDTFASLVHPDDMPIVEKTLQDYLQGKIKDYAVEIRMRRKDDGYKWILSRGKVVSRDIKGAPLRMTGIHTDISARIQAEEDLIAARTEAERANQAKSDFLSRMSHELRTPMNAILGFSQLLEIQGGLANEQMENVQEIIKSGNHLLSLIDEILDLSKVESGHVDVSLEPVELDSIVHECLNLIGFQAEKNNIQLSFSGLDGIVVRADRIRLKQAILNLLSNAIKYNKEGGSVKLDTQVVGDGQLHIRVTDTGRGIPPEREAELFRPFNRLGAENSEIEGTGIGLTLTRRIVEMMGGSIDVETELGVGSTFWIELPIESLPDFDQKKIDSLNTGTADDSDSIQHTVLYIEDNPVNLKLVAKIFGQRKHISLHTTHIPEHGIELARKLQPELILLDINMQGMDGYQVLEIFKTDLHLRDIPVVAVTANAMHSDIQSGMAAGFSDYLTKPIDVNKFLDVIDRYLAGTE